MLHLHQHLVSGVEQYDRKGPVKQTRGGNVLPQVTFFFRRAADSLVLFVDDDALFWYREMNEDKYYGQPSLK